MDYVLKIYKFPQENYQPIVPRQKHSIVYTESESENSNCFSTNLLAVQNLTRISKSYLKTLNTSRRGEAAAILFTTASHVLEQNRL